MHKFDLRRRPQHVVVRFSRAPEGFGARLEFDYHWRGLQALPGDYRVLAWEKPSRSEGQGSSNPRAKQV